MPTFIGARLPAPREQPTDHRTRQHELRLDRDADAVPSASAVEEQLATRTKPGQDMLEIRHGRRGPAEHGGVEGSAPSCEKTQGEKTTADLEAPVGNVVVRHPIARDVQGRPEQESERT